MNVSYGVKSCASISWSIKHTGYIYPLITLFCFTKGDKFAANFLIKNGARVNAATLGDQETPLHLVASYSPKKHSPDVMAEMAQIAQSLLQAGANPNMQDNKGR